MGQKHKMDVVTLDTVQNLMNGIWSNTKTASKSQQLYRNAFQNRRPCDLIFY